MACIKVRGGVLAIGVLLFSLIVPAALSAQGKSRMQLEEVKLSAKEYNDFKAAHKKFKDGEMHMAQDKENKAEKSFRSCLKKFPRYAAADYYMAKIMYNKGQFKKGMDHILNAKKNFKFMSSLLFQAEKKTKEDLKLEMQNLRNDARDSNYGDMSSGQSSDRRTRMRSIGKRLRKRMDGGRVLYPDYFYVQGNLHFKMKQLKEAYGQYIQALNLKPDHANTYNNLINLLFMAKKYKDAANFLKAAQENNVEVNPKLKEAVLKASGN